MSRVIALQLHVGEPDLAHVEECPGCGFDALLTMPVFLLSDYGVSTLGSVKACPRCLADEGGRA